MAPGEQYHKTPFPWPKNLLAAKFPTEPPTVLLQGAYLVSADLRGGIEWLCPCPQGQLLTHLQRPASLEKPGSYSFHSHPGLVRGYQDPLWQPCSWGHSSYMLKLAYQQL